MEYPTNHDDFLKFIKDTCGLPDNYKESDIPLSSSYWQHINAYRTMMTNGELTMSSSVTESIPESVEEKKKPVNIADFFKDIKK